ncbi:MAG: acyl-CoA dehydrogenase family protein [Gemmataceae bacterium]|nr:acyl-CoA dehydrogenase family protein [Gemmataceae bacterium]
MALSAAQIEQQKKQAEELLFSGPQHLGFAKGLYFGQFNGSILFPYPELKPEEQAATRQAIDEVRSYCQAGIDAAAIDRDALIPQSVIDGLAGVGVMGMTAPPEFGGRDFGQLAYTKVMEVVGGHCASTAVFVNAHHSIGIRALLLFGTEEQKRRWLPDLCSARKLAAFALTENEAGSDASNVQTTATPATRDGKEGFVLNGGKRWITNGGIAGVLTVMARTPGLAGGASKKKEITAFIVTPDMPGFKVIDARMEKNSIRGTATGKLAFEDMFVPKENVLWQVGKGLRIALTVLDFGRTTFGASCTGVAKACVEATVRHAKKRVQFEQALAEFELVKKKIAFMAAHAFAMEAMTAECASFIDRGFEDFMLETAMLKVWSTDALWKIVNDCLQVHGGKGFFMDEPYERWMRDARLNLVGEGANDVLRAFIAMVGIKPLADSLLKVKEASASPFKNFGTLLRFGAGMVWDHFRTPAVPVQTSALRPFARTLGTRVRDFAVAVRGELFKHRDAILFKQLVQERIADAACELYASACVLARLDSLSAGNGHAATAAHDLAVGKHYLRFSDRRIRQNLAALGDHDDASTLSAAEAALGRFA